MVKDTGEKEAPKAEETPNESDALQKQVDELTLERDKALEDGEKATESMKGHQRISEERLSKLREAEVSGTRLTSLEKQQNVLLDMMADLVDRGDLEDEPPKGRRSEEYLKRLKKEEEAPPASQLSPEAQEAVRLVQLAGMNFNTSPELAEAYRLLSLELYSEGLEATKKVIAGKTKTVEPKKELSDEDIKAILKNKPELVDEIAREVFEKSGQNVSDVGKPQSGSTNDAQFKADFGSGKLPYNKENEARAKKLLST